MYLIHTPFGIPEFQGPNIPTDSNGDIIFEKDTDHVAIWKVTIMILKRCVFSLY